MLYQKRGDKRTLMRQNEPTPSVPVLIYKYSAGPDPDWLRKAWAAALVLMVVVMLLNFGIRWATGKRVVLASRAD